MNTTHISQIHASKILEISRQRVSQLIAAGRLETDPIPTIPMIRLSSLRQYQREKQAAQQNRTGVAKRNTAKTARAKKTP